MKIKSILYLTVCLLLASGQFGFGQLVTSPTAKKAPDTRTPYTLLFDGNSWVAGSGSTGGSNFPNQVKALFKDAGATVTITNFGIPGQYIDQMEKNAPTKIDPCHKDYQFLIGMELVNQWGNTTQTKEEIYAKYKKYFLDRKAAGFQKVIALTPLAQGYYHRAGWEADRQWFIAKMLEEFPKLGIYVANVGADPKLSDWKNTTYYGHDKIHPINAGYAVIAGIVYDSILKAT